LCGLAVIPAALLMAQAPPPSAAPAGDPGWKTKLPVKWTPQDAKQVLTSSPWAKYFSGGLARRQSEDELRQGGQMGQPQGPGYDHVDPKGSGWRPTPNIFYGKGAADRSARSLPGTIPLGLRWESALPVRLAETMSHQDELAIDGDGYQIAVFGVPTPDKMKDPEKMGEPLKEDAALKRDGKKDVKPVKVEVYFREEGLVIIYLFPLSAELTKKDGRVQFVAHIGRVVVNQYFDLAQMEFQGKLEL
jgi:hypothetical protein